MFYTQLSNEQISNDATRVDLTSRSRALAYQRCPRSRWWLHECKLQGQSPHGGLELKKQSIPLATGAAVHSGLAQLLMGTKVDDAVLWAQFQYRESCEQRKLDVPELEQDSFAYGQQLHLLEGLIRLADLRVLPKLLELYEVLEIEKIDKTLLCSLDNNRNVVWRSIPDALLRNREDRDLYLLSWKTCSTYGASNKDDARVDMQGLSEAWAIHSRLPPTEKIRGIQMIYLVKGSQWEMGKTDSLRWLTEEQYQSGMRLKKVDSPLLWGYRDNSFPPQYVSSLSWRCKATHPMHRSKWYPQGECPGDGRLHRRGDEFSLFPAFEEFGCKEWLRMLSTGEVDTGGVDPLESLWVMPIPQWRTTEDIERWHRQIRRQEATAIVDASVVRSFEEDANNSSRDQRVYQVALDNLFPQFTHSCRIFNRRCDAWEICHGPHHVAQDPIGSGLFQAKTGYTPVGEKAVDGEDT